jgi:hypothetical protein
MNLGEEGIAQIINRITPQIKADSPLGLELLGLLPWSELITFGEGLQAPITNAIKPTVAICFFIFWRANLLNLTCHSI